jgi:DNA-directed RNA polymerase alpha subunit
MGCTRRYRRAYRSDRPAYGSRVIEFTRARYDVISSPPPNAPLFVRPIDDLRITAPTLDLLKAANIWYVGDLVQRTESDLRDNRLSSSAVVEVRTALWAHRLDLKKE